MRISCTKTSTQRGCSIEIIGCAGAYSNLITLLTSVEQLAVVVKGILIVQLNNLTHAKMCCVIGCIAVVFNAACNSRLIIGAHSASTQGAFIIEAIIIELLSHQACTPEVCIAIAVRTIVKIGVIAAATVFNHRHNYQLTGIVVDFLCKAKIHVPCFEVNVRTGIELLIVSAHGDKRINRTFFLPVNSQCSVFIACSCQQIMSQVQHSERSGLCFNRRFCVSISIKAAGTRSCAATTRRCCATATRRCCTTAARRCCATAARRCCTTATRRCCATAARRCCAIDNSD